MDLADARFAITVNDQRRQADVVCHHPAFPALTDDLRENVAHHAVEWAVGEDDAIIWVDEVTWSLTEPACVGTAAELREAVGALAAGPVHWRPWSGAWDGLPARMSVATPLRTERWPRFDMYVAVVLPYSRYDEGKLPADESVDALGQFEDELIAAAGADGALVARITHDGKRVLQFYVDSQSDARAELVSRLPRWQEGEALTYGHLDPLFDELERYAELWA